MLKALRATISRLRLWNTGHRSVGICTRRPQIAADADGRDRERAIERRLLLRKSLENHTRSAAACASTTAIPTSLNWDGTGMRPSPPNINREHRCASGEDHSRRCSPPTAAIFPFRPEWSSRRAQPQSDTLGPVCAMTSMISCDLFA